MRRPLLIGVVVIATGALPAARLKPVLSELVLRPFDALRVVPSTVEGRQAQDERVEGPRTPPVAKRNGHVQTFWPNGHMKSDVTYRDDAYDSEYRTWYESGMPYESRHYAGGHEEGLQQSWTEAGALYLNYEVRNGRRYGFVNSAPCVTVGDHQPRLPYYDSHEFTPRWTPVAHRIGSFDLTRQTGGSISDRSLRNRVHVASFIYTKCAAVCPILIQQLARVRAATDALIVSYTVTPDVDTPAALSAFGRERGIDPSRWWLVTGNREQIYRLARRSYFADDDRASGAVFLHTEKVLLVDRAGQLRGVYNGTQPHDIDQLIADIATLD
jgi:protein SCO1